MTRVNSRPKNDQAPDEWAKAYAAFLGLVGLVLLILLAKGLHLASALIVGVVIAVAVLVRRFGNYLRKSKG
ncbi:MAG: hypothetical protein M1343_10475 [Chloroflexi bacterium]|nr:hypothetical protein [Chloroflexota bacterium]MDA8217770.1 hypothetical protein [Dehalococcoidales bacterium]